MKNLFRAFYGGMLVVLLHGCTPAQQKEPTAADILGNADYPAICYGGYRMPNRAQAPTVAEIKEDLIILHASGFRVLRTYHARLYSHTPNVLRAISELKAADPNFEMYVMLGTWMQCADAWTAQPNHEKGDSLQNAAEIDAAIHLAQTYPDIVKIIAVGNEAMVHWAAGYYVGADVILKWVKHLKAAKAQGRIPAETWITSSDNFASWGGGETYYHTSALAKLVQAVDYLSVHTYPFHDTHYNPDFWLVPAGEESAPKKALVDAGCARAVAYAKQQYAGVKAYLDALGIDKPIHIGETGWATVSSGLYGAAGSRAADEYKQAAYYNAMRAWTDEAGISCFFFEAFDEPWKDGNDPNGSENHFGLFTVTGQAKYALWHLVENGTLRGLSRGGHAIERTMRGNEHYVMLQAGIPPFAQHAAKSTITWPDEDHKLGEAVTADFFVVLGEAAAQDAPTTVAHPAAKVKLNAWDGTCTIERSDANTVRIKTGTGAWWGCALELDAAGGGENMRAFENGFLHLEVKGTTAASLQIGFQTGIYSAGNQVNAHVAYANGLPDAFAEAWQAVHIPIRDIRGNANVEDVTSLLYVLGSGTTDGKEIQLRNIYWSRD